MYEQTYREETTNNKMTLTYIYFDYSLTLFKIK